MYRCRARLLPILSRLLFPLLVCLSPGTSRAVPPRYAVVEIGLLPGYGSFGYANGINNHGDVVGTSHFFSEIPSWPPVIVNRWHAFLWRDGVLQDLGTLYDDSSTSTATSSANAISDAGVIVGISGPPDSGIWVAFQWKDGQMTALPLLPGGQTSEAYDVNDLGWITGGASTAASARNNHAVVWKGGIPQSLDPLQDDTHSYSYGYGINRQGDIVGYSSVIGAFTVPHDGPLSLQAIPNVFGKADDINNAGQVTGSRFSTNSWSTLGEPFLWQSGTYTALPAPNGQYDYNASAINEAGDVVGRYHNIVQQARACLWSKGEVYDLNSLVVGGPHETLMWAKDINDLGQIVGSGTSRPFLLTPLLYGDADGNVRVDIADVKATLRAASGLGLVRVPVAADVSPAAPSSGAPGDGLIDLCDAFRILRQVQGLEPSWP